MGRPKKGITIYNSQASASPCSFFHHSFATHRKSAQFNPKKKRVGAMQACTKDVYNKHRRSKGFYNKAHVYTFSLFDDGARWVYKVGIGRLGFSINRTTYRFHACISLGAYFLVERGNITLIYCSIM